MSQMPYNPNMPPMPPPPVRGMEDVIFNSGYGYPPQGGGYPGCPTPQQAGYPGYPPPQGAGYGYPPPQGTGYPSYPLQQGAMQGPPQTTYPNASGYPAQPQQLPAPGYGFVPASAPYGNTGNAYATETGPRYDYGKVEDGVGGFSFGPDGYGASFSDKAIRHAFIRKVYMILSAQLLMTTCFIALFVLHDGVKLFVRRNIWTYYLGYVVFIITYFTLICCSSVRRKYPGNVIALLVFTLAMSYMVAVISSFYQTKIILMAGGTCAVVCLAISLFAMQTKMDFTLCNGFLVVASVIFFIFGILMIFFRDVGPMRIVYSACGALLFSAFLAYDTQMVIGGKRMELSAEEYILGALQLYMDIVNIFMHLLQLFRGVSD